MSLTTEQTNLGQTPVDGTTAADDDLVLWSVTTIIGALDKPALLYWAAEQTAAAATGAQSTWRGMIDDCPPGCEHDSARTCDAVKWLRDARFRRPKNLLSATALGTVVHDLCENYALSGTKPDKNAIADTIDRVGGPQVDIRREGPVAHAMLEQFDAWLQRFSPTYEATEVAVYHPTYGYAGTADAFLSIDGWRAVIDYKTSREPTDGRGKPKNPYPESALQLAAYRYAEHAAVWRPRRTEKFRRRYYLLGPAEQAMAQPVPEVDGGLTIFITPDSCEAHPVRCDETVHRTFLHTQEVARWSFNVAKNVVGAPIVPHAQEAS